MRRTSVLPTSTLVYVAVAIDVLQRPICQQTPASRRGRCFRRGYSPAMTGIAALRSIFVWHASQSPRSLGSADPGRECGADAGEARNLAIGASRARVELTCPDKYGVRHLDYLASLYASW